MSTSVGKHVLILGGGFGGLYTALGLEKTLACDPGLRVTLVNRENFSLFTPMLHEVAASDLDMTHVVNPLRKLLKHVHFINGEVVQVELSSKQVTIVHGPAGHVHKLQYDYLVLALGSDTNFFGLPGLKERALTIKSLRDAMHLRSRLISLLEQADVEDDGVSQSRLLTVVAAAGGFAGTETVAAVNDFLRESIRFYPNLSQESIRIVLVHPSKVILPELGPKLGEYAQKKLAQRGVELRLSTKVLNVAENQVLLSDGSCIETRTLIWTAGTSPNPLISQLPCHSDNGRVVTNGYLELPDWPGVWALGDCASIFDRRSGRPYPPTAQHAVRQGKTVATNVTAAILGGAKAQFSFSTLGLLATIGRRTGVASIFGFKFSGLIAWFLWRTIYLSKLPRMEKKFRVALDWSLDLLFSKDLVNFLELNPQSPRRSGQQESDAVTAPEPHT